MWPSVVVESDPVSDDAGGVLEAFKAVAVDLPDRERCQPSSSRVWQSITSAVLRFAVQRLISSSMLTLIANFAPYGLSSFSLGRYSPVTDRRSSNQPHRRTRALEVRELISSIAFRPDAYH